MIWKLCGHNFIYQPNADGINRWYASVQAGFDDTGERVGSEEVERITRWILAAPTMLGALLMVVNSTAVLNHLDSETQQFICDTIKKAKGETK